MIEPQEEHVLVLEDDAPLREGLVRMLARQHEGWRVEGAGSLQEAVGVLQGRPFSAVVLDLGLPDARGLEVLGRLRQVQPLSAMVVITGQADEKLALRALAMGAQEYLVKGDWTSRQLHRALRYAIERKRAERTSLNANLMLASILDAFRAAIAIIAGNGHIFATNAKWRESADDNRFVRGSGPGTDYLALCRRLQSVEHLGTEVAAKGILAVAEGRLPTFRVEYPSDGGDPQWFGLTVTGFRIEGAIHLLVSVSNTTEQVRLTTEMRRHQHLFKLITDHTTDLIAIVDRTGKRLYESPSYSTLLGWSQEELGAMEPLALLHPDDRRPIQKALLDVFRTGQGSTVVYRMRTKAGPYLTFESHSSVVRDPQGGNEAALFSARDVTSRIEAEADRDRMEVQLRAAQKLESIGQLAAGIAHEINTPIQYIGDNTRFLRDAFGELTTIIAKHRDLFGALDLASVPPEFMKQVAGMAKDANFEYLQDEIPRAAEETLDGVERVATIVKALKEFSYPMGEDPVMMDVNHCIETTLMVAKNEWKYHADMEMDLDPELPTVPGFPGEFNQVVLNLVVNAVHAIQDALRARGEDRGRIRLRTRKEGDSVLVEVEDTGLGIPPEVRERIFDPFFTTKGVGKGTGQGLSIAHNVMEKHQGRIHFETRMGEGTTFVLRLPLKRIEGAKP